MKNLFMYESKSSLNEAIIDYESSQFSHRNPKDEAIQSTNPTVASVSDFVTETFPVSSRW